MRKLLCALALLIGVSAHADDVTWKVGATIFADYTTTPDASSFNVGRAYINVTGTLHRRIAFRLTPDISRETGVVRKRTITGVAWWFPNLKKATAAVMVDRDSLSVTGRDDDTRYGVKMLLVF